jgi:rhodanese-related sulfurtransferase
MTITPPRDVLSAEYDLIDVRTPAEYRQTHARGSRNIPLDSLGDSEIAAIAATKKRIALICKSGSRARKAAELLESKGLSPIVVEGGTDAWHTAGLPVESSGQRVISLERQVRIGAGTMVVLGVVLGFAVHPGFFGLSAFVGCGLIFAGVTDWCGMGLLLARCPWNR